MHGSGGCPNSPPTNDLRPSSPPPSLARAPLVASADGSVSGSLRRFVSDARATQHNGHLAMFQGAPNRRHLEQRSVSISLQMSNLLFAASAHQSPASAIL